MGLSNEEIQLIIMELGVDQSVWMGVYCGKQFSAGFVYSAKQVDVS